MNYKQGDIIENKNGKRKVLGVCGEVCFMSLQNNYDEATDHCYTQKKLDELGYSLVQSDWKPEYDGTYYFVNVEGDVDRYDWCSSYSDKKRLELGNCYRTRELAEKARERVLKAYKGE